MLLWGSFGLPPKKLRKLDYYVEAAEIPSSSFKIDKNYLEYIKTKRFYKRKKSNATTLLKKDKRNTANLKAEYFNFYSGKAIRPTK